MSLGQEGGLAPQRGCPAGDPALAPALSYMRFFARLAPNR
jgi:hypothetical protein